jgi:hemolysin activation/secretion protein
MAVRAAGGITDERSADLFSAGGVSGNLIEVFPGVQLGEQRRTFGVRGYPVSAEQGIRAYTGTIEYRAPLMAPSRGFRFVPVFVDKVSVSVFSDVGRAFCPAGVDTTNGVCRPADVSNPMMRSAGLELNVDTGVQLDFQARLRLGLAFPLANRQEFDASRAQAYATFGASF